MTPDTLDLVFVVLRSSIEVRSLASAHRVPYNVREYGPGVLRCFNFPQHIPTPLTTNGVSVAVSECWLSGAMHFPEKVKLSPHAKEALRRNRRLRYARGG